MPANLTALGFTPYATVWGLGSYDDPVLAFNGRDGDGVMWVLEKVKGWKTTTFDQPIVRSGGDGGWFGVGSRQPKTMTLSGAFRSFDPATLEEAERRLRAALETPGADQTLWVDGATPQQMTIRPSGAVDVDDTNPWSRTWSAVVTAADPVKYAAGVGGLIVVTLGVAQQTGAAGIAFPVSFPLSLSGGTNPAWAATVNPGDMPVWPVVEFDGPVVSPVLQHVTSNSQFGVAGGLADGIAATSDFRYANLLVDGASARSRRAPGSVYFPVVAGRNDFHLVVDPTLNPASSLSPHTRVTVSYRPAWR